MKSIHVALLRGINVGGKNKLPMKELVQIFADAGGENAETYIQSGNVVFSASSPARTAVIVSKGIAERYGYKIPVVLRSAEELRAVADHNPFLPGEKNTELLHVYFLVDLPHANDIAALDRSRSPPDRFAVSGREIFLRLPNGMGRTKLTNAYFDSKLKTTSTARNWRTVLELVKMTER